MNISLANPTARIWIFNGIKYLVYGILAYNGFLFYVDEMAASATTFQHGLSFSEIIKVYSASIDSTFWLLLVALLELETYLIPDEVLRRPRVKWTMIFLRSLCYGMICYALYGYIVKSMFQADIVPFAIANVCALADQGYSILIELEEYIPLTPDSCQTLAGQELYRLNGYNIIGPLPDMEYARNVQFIDVINASTWLGIVAVLEMDVWYQLKGEYEGTIYKVSYILKAAFYTTLIGCALAWGYTGVPLDIVDAALWLFAFFFIELNLFTWHQETEEAEAAAEKAGATV